MILAKNNNTDVSFWQSQPLVALRPWIKANNAIAKSGKEGGSGQ